MYTWVHGALHTLTLESFSWYVPDHPGKPACDTCCGSSQWSVGTSLPSAQTQSLHLDTHTSHTGLETQNPIVIRTLYNGVHRLVGTQTISGS